MLADGPLEREPGDAGLHGRRQVLRRDVEDRRGPDAAERQKKIDERLPRERALAAHTLLIAKSKFDDILKKRAELLEKKEGKKK